MALPHFSDNYKYFCRECFRIVPLGCVRCECGNTHLIGVNRSFEHIYVTNRKIYLREEKLKRIFNE